MFVFFLLVAWTLLSVGVGFAWGYGVNTYKKQHRTDD